MKTLPGGGPYCTEFGVNAAGGDAAAAAAVAFDDVGVAVMRDDDDEDVDVGGDVKGADELDEGTWKYALKLVLKIPKKHCKKVSNATYKIEPCSTSYDFKIDISR